MVTNIFKHRSDLTTPNPNKSGGMWTLSQSFKKPAIPKQKTTSVPNTIQATGFATMKDLEKVEVKVDKLIEKLDQFINREPPKAG